MHLERFANYMMGFYNDLGPWMDEDNDQVMYWISVPCDGDTDKPTYGARMLAEQAAVKKFKEVKGRNIDSPLVAWSLEFECFTYRQTPTLPEAVP